MATPYILYDNRFRTATPTATSGANAAFVSDYRAYTTWTANNNAAHRVSVDCGANAAADTLCIVRHNLGTIGSNVTPQYSADGNNWSNAANAAIPSGNNTYATTFNTQSARYWAIHMNDQNAAPSIGEVFMGTRLTFPRMPDGPYTPYTYEVEAEQAIGKTGHILGSTLRYTGVTINATFSHLTKAWVYGDFMTFWNTHGRLLRPFFWVWDSANAANDVFYVTMDPKARFSAPLRTYTYTERLQLEMVGVKE